VSDWLLVEDGDRRYRVAVAKDGTATWVFVDGIVARVDDDAPASPRRKKSGASEVMSPMPATVVTINAQPGQTVAEGETVIVLEAMKMELPIRAPRGGVVKAIHCAKGDLVQPGVNLLEIE
jgi:3-methylcrotonyl-CoA carboxylase alpha subunit